MFVFASADETQRKEKTSKDKFQSLRFLLSRSISQQRSTLGQFESTVFIMTETNDCGVLGFYPRWLKNKATPKLFMAIYGLLGTVQAMSFVYLTVILTTLEKRFKIPSRTTGIMLCGNEISQVLSLVLVFYGSTGHRPRWIAVGVGLSAAACFVLAAPHFIYGPGKDALALTQEHLDQTLLNATTSKPEESLVCPRQSGPKICDEDDFSDSGILPRLLVFGSQFVLGIGTTLYYGLGQAYMDDNSKKKSAPMLLGVTFALRTIGPVIGFVLGYGCLTLYIDPSLHPVITKDNPRWLGAWWLGWIILGVVMGIFAVLIAMFPKTLPKPENGVAEKDGEIPLKLNSARDGSVPAQKLATKPAAKISPGETPLLKDFLKAMARILKNKIVMCNNVSAVFYVIGIAGYMTFFAKYLEVQFGTSAASGTVVAGPVSLIGMVFGFMGSGVVISKFKPGPRKLLFWNVIVGTSFLLGLISFMFIKCPEPEIQGLDLQTSKLNFTTSCNVGCGCEGIKFAPVCHEASGTTFYSACHAGCTTILESNEFGGCSCISGVNETANSSSGTIDYKVKAGPCPTDCTQAYLLFLIQACLLQAMACSGKISNVLVNYRAVETRDKSIALGFSLMILSLFALIPGPIISGTIIDATCLIWEKSCGGKGNCWVYHRDNFRQYLNLTAASFVLIGVIFDFLVWYWGKDLDLYGAGEEDKRREFVSVNDPVAASGEINRGAEVRRNVIPGNDTTEKTVGAR
ncbi:solute carrier organic anion transporter family member 74D isoform X2 [Athalia rosae]|uniref:solute carrier organic anion transporter family member 74D isoform X2 n=1 Tax=Athalia rosae TaxID=37344 RepID=UPI00203342D3|nr:solute carrier organic anion transporter family member 74D isoform X2 [Athalia rosae]